MQVVVTAALLVWIFHDPTLLGQMRRTLARAELPWLAAGAALGGIWLAAAAYRWQVFLKVQGVQFAFWRTGSVYLIAMFFTLFLPGAISSDAVRIVYLFRERVGTKTAVLLSVMMDRLAGLLAMTATAVAVVMLRRDWLAQSPITEGAMYALAAFLVLSVLGLAVSLVLTQTGLVRRVPQRMPFRRQMIEFAVAFGAFLREWRLSLRGLVASFVTLYAYFGTFYCAGRAFGAGVSLADMFSIMPLVDAIIMLPVTVSGLGVREKLFEAMLRTLSDVPSDTALLISLAGFGMSVVWFLAGAVLFPLYRPARAQPTRDWRALVRDARDV